MFWRMLAAIWFAGHLGCCKWVENHPGEKYLICCPKRECFKEMLFSETMGFNRI